MSLMKAGFGGMGASAGGLLGQLIFPAWLRRNVRPSLQTEVEIISVSPNGRRPPRLRNCGRMAIRRGPSHEPCHWQSDGRWLD